MPVKKLKLLKKSSTKSTKIMVDVQKPEDVQQNTGNKPAIVGNKPVVEDPMIAKKTDRPKVEKKERKILDPNESKNEGKEEVSEIEDSGKSPDEPKVELKVKKVEAENATEKPEKTEEPEAESSDEETDEDDERSDEDIGGWTDKIHEIAEEKKADDDEKSTETEGDAGGGKWQEFAPGDASDEPEDKKKKDHINIGHKVTWILTGLFTSLIVILVVLNILLDLEMIDIGINPITNFF